MGRVLRPDSNCVDVGCHRGDFLREMLRLAPAGSHHAFEPIPEMYAELVATFPAARVYDYALSEAAGEVTFAHVTSNPGYSGLRECRYDRPHEDVTQITVRTERLDNLLPPDLPVNLLKVDVEGAELQVLRGATETLRRWRPFIVFEHGLGAADCYGTTPEQVYDLLASCGLSVSLMADWLAGGRPLTREAFCEQFYQGLNFYFIAHPAA